MSVPATATAGTPLTLTGVVVPANATNQNIAWSVKNANGTGAAITSGNILNATAAGTAVITATIANGETAYLVSVDNPFTDIKNSDWYYDNVIFTYAHGLMVGTAANEFSPNMPMTRGMLVTVLYRMAGSPKVNDLANPFIDVSSDKYYADSVKWAAANGIVNGYGNGKFGSDDNISRQDLAVVLYRFANHSGITGPPLQGVV